MISYLWPDPPRAGGLLDVAPGVIWLRMPLPFKLDHINLWLLEDGDGWTAVDTGVGLEETRALWDAALGGRLAGRPVTRIVVTHEVEGPGVDVAAIRRSIELSALKYCPVNAMLSAGATEIHHRYVVRNTGPEPFESEGEAAVTGPYRRPDAIA